MPALGERWWRCVWRESPIFIVNCGAEKILLVAIRRNYLIEWYRVPRHYGGAYTTEQLLSALLGLRVAD